MRFLINKLHVVIPTAYLLGGVFVWINFSHLPPDGLANVGIALYTLPVVLMAKLLTTKEFPFVEGEYYQAHMIYFLVSVVLIAVFLFLILFELPKILQKGQSNTE